MAINTSDPKVQKALLVILMTGGILYAYFTYVFAPKKEDLANLAGEVKKLEVSLSTARAIVQASDTLALIDEFDKRGRELELAEKLLPEEENLPQLLQEITVEANRQNVGFSLFEPKPPVQHELFQERPYQVKLRGGYHETAMFLANVAGLPQIVKPGGVKLTRDTRTGAEEGETVTADMVLTTYLMIPAPPVSQATANKQGKK